MSEAPRIVSNVSVWPFEAAKAIIQEHIARMKPEDVCALIIFEIRFSPDMPEKTTDGVRHRMEQVLSGSMKPSNLLARMDDDMFLVVDFNPESAERVLAKMRDMRGRLDAVAGAVQDADIHVCVGTAFACGTLLTFDPLLEQACAALAAARTAEDGCAVMEFPVAVPFNAVVTRLTDWIALYKVGETAQLVYVSSGFYHTMKQNAGRHVQLGSVRDILIHQSDAVQHNEAIIECFSKNVGTENTFRFSVDGGNWRWCRSRFLPIGSLRERGAYVLVLSSDITEEKKNEEQLAMENTFLRLLNDNTSMLFWKVDLRTGFFSVINERGDDLVSDWHFPDDILRRELIHPNSVVAFQRLAELLLSGKSSSSVMLQIRFGDVQRFRWVAVRYHFLTDDNGMPVKAVGVTTAVDNTGRESVLFLMGAERAECFHSHVILTVRVNLTENLVEEVWSEGRNFTDYYGKIKYSEIIAEKEERCFSHQEKSIFSRLFSRQALLEAYREKRYWITLEYRRVNNNGDINWVAFTVNLIKQVFSDSVYAFIVLRDVNKKYLWESYREGKLSRNNITGVYDDHSTKNLMRGILYNENHDTSAVVFIQPLLKKNENMDILRPIVSSLMSLFFDGSYLVGSYKDNIVVFFHDVESWVYVHATVKKAFDFVRRAIAGNYEELSLYFTANIYLGKVDDSNIDHILLQLSNLYVNVKRQVYDDEIFIYDSSFINFDDGLEYINDFHLFSYDKDNIENLSKKEREVLYKSIFSMISSSSIEVSVKNILNHIGKFYNADRAYIVFLDEKSANIFVPYEWLNNGKRSIKNIISEYTLDTFPLLKHCYKHKKPLRTKRNELVTDFRKYNSWEYEVFPIIYNSVIKGFLCIENAKTNIDSIAIVEIILFYFVQEQKRIENSKSNYIEKIDELTKTKNFYAYCSELPGFSSDKYSTMGCFVVDFADIPSMDNRYGNYIILNISELLERFFGKNVFRTEKTKFVALYPNVLEQIFITRCTRLRTVLQNKYADHVHCGFSWAKEFFSAEKLVQEAQSIMMSNTSLDLSREESFQLGKTRYATVEDAVAEGRFTVYFQPRIDVSTGKICGAEALVRGLDEEGKTVSPLSFIGKMEELGMIKNLDLFVLDFVLECLERWHEHGLITPCISVNFSRYTLFNYSLSGALLAIFSRHERFAVNLIEVEITESVCNVESGTLNRVMDEFRRFGLKFSLDDFGSGYSNLSIFTNVKFNTVKLDRSLITDINKNIIGRTVVGDIIHICDTQKMTCVAEGVETKEQLETLITEGCRYVQGYYYDRPLSKNVFESKYLKAHHEQW